VALPQCSMVTNRPTEQWVFDSMYKIENSYSLGPILPFINMDVSNTKICPDIFVFVKGNMSQRSTILCTLLIMMMIS
jgi:hypothetical protein